MSIEVDKEKIDGIHPHIDGGCIVKVNGFNYHVKELVDDVLSKPPF